MKIKLIELRIIGVALGKVIGSNISLSLRHDISVYLKTLENHLKAMDENQQKLVKDSGIEDLQKEAKEKTERFIKIEENFKNYLENTEVEITDCEITWDKIMKFGDSIILLPIEEFYLKSITKEKE